MRMLKNLVKKFKSHSLNEQEDDDQIMEQQETEMATRHQHHLRNLTTPTAPEYGQVDRVASSQHLIRQTCCDHKRTMCPHHRQIRYQQAAKFITSNKNEHVDHDSGTESDEELEYIETNSTHSVPVSQTSDYYASQQSLSINSCRSSHCGSPLLALSDQECNSWESFGSESGINLRATTIRQQITNTIGRIAMDGSNTAPKMITEELPNHHYHTRQQFQRLKQQISMTDGNTIDTEPTKFTVYPFSSNDYFKKLNINNTAFTPFTRATSDITSGAQKSPAGSGSSFDELEEINSLDGSGKCSAQNDKQKLGNQTVSRRCRSSTLSTVSSGISSSGISTWSSASSTSSSISGHGNGNGEKRKWSQIRQQQKNECCCFCRDCGLNGQELQQRPVLRAPRKTPVKLLYPPAQNQEKTIEDFRKMEVSEQRKTRFSSRKKCRPDDESKSLNAEESEQDGNEILVKRPSLDFNKMRAKRVDGAASKCKRSSSLNGVTRSILRDPRRNNYHLRSTRRQNFLFRPLDPPILTLANQTPSNYGAANLFSLNFNPVRFE